MRNGFISPLLVVGIVAGVLAIGLGVQTKRLESAKAEHATFVATVKAAGEEAQRKAKATEAANEKRINGAITERNAAIARLRDERASRSRVPILPATAENADRICLSRAKFESAFGTLATDIQGIAEVGDIAIINNRAWLNSWPK